MKRIFISLFALLMAFSVSAQDNTIRLIVSGEGTTKKEATINALRSAIEQAFGTFVSANTQILNDEIVKDEIVTISSGNILKYNELGCITLPSGNKSVSLSATVSIGNLISYAKSKGSSAEFAGAEFAMNMKMRKLNAENEKKALFNMLDQLYELAPSVYDWELKVGDPIITSTQQYKIPFVVKSVANEASRTFYSILTNTFQSLSLTYNEVKGYNQNGMKVYQVGIEDKIYYLRNSPSEILTLIQYLIYCINKSYNIVGSSNSGDNVSIKLEYADRSKYIEYRPDHIELFRNGKSDESYTMVSEEVLYKLQGFKIHNAPVTRFRTENQNNVIVTTGLIVYQPIKIPKQIDIKSLKYLVIKNGLERIEHDQFSGCNNLLEVYIGDCVKDVGVSSFQSCKSLKEVVIGNGVESIRSQAFLECKSLNTVILGDNVEYIEEDAFLNCNISKINFPHSIKFIGESAFSGNNLQEIYLNSIVPPILGSYSFGAPNEYNVTFKLFVPKQSIERYKNKDMWRSYSLHIVGYEVSSSDKEN